MDGWEAEATELPPEEVIRGRRSRQVYRYIRDNPQVTGVEIGEAMGITQQAASIHVGIINKYIREYGFSIQNLHRGGNPGGGYYISRDGDLHPHDSYFISLVQRGVNTRSELRELGYLPKPIKGIIKRLKQKGIRVEWETSIRPQRLKIISNTSTNGD